MSSDKPESFGADYFDKLYADQADPWNFATSGYERRKYLHTLEALKWDRNRFRSALEVGCSIGILTRQLAAICHVLFAIDVAQTAVAKAKINCKDLRQVTIQRMRIPSEWPNRTFDLILFSEVLYFLGPDDIGLTADRSMDSIIPGGLILLVNWTGETNYPCSGDEAVERYLTAFRDRAKAILYRRELSYRLDLLRAF